MPQVIDNRRSSDAGACSIVDMEDGRRAAISGPPLNPEQLKDMFLKTGGIMPIGGISVGSHIRDGKQNDTGILRKKPGAAGILFALESSTHPDGMERTAVFGTRAADDDLKQLMTVIPRELEAGEQVNIVPLELICRSANLE